MSFKSLFAAGLGLVLMAGPAVAWQTQQQGHGYGHSAPAAHAPAPMPLYSYDASANYCPGGLQPVVLNGVICCGSPTAGSYDAMMRHPAPAARAHYTPRPRYQPQRARVACPVGQKGCSPRY